MSIEHVKRAKRQKIITERVFCILNNGVETAVFYRITWMEHSFFEKEPSEQARNTMESYVRNSLSQVLKKTIN